MDQQRDWTVISIKVKEPTCSINFKEIGHIIIIGKSGTKTYQSDVSLGSFLGSEQSGNNRLDDPTSLVVEKMDLIKDNKMDIFEDSCTFSGCDVPLFRSGN